MRVLVTGCHGFLGHHVTAALASRGHQVTGVDRIRDANSKKTDRIAAWAKIIGNVRFLEADLSRLQSARQVIDKARPEAIFHAAGQYSIRYTTENLGHYVQGNLLAMVNVLEAAALAKVRRFVYASSQAISDARRPSGLYGATKGFGEDALAAYCHRNNMAGVALRYGVLYGPMIRRDTDFFRTVDAHLRGQPAKPGSQWDKRTPMIEVRDATEIAVRSIEASTQGMLTLPAVAWDKSHSYRDVLHAAAELSGMPLRDTGEAPARADILHPNIEPTRQALGWVPSITLRQGMGAYLEWARTATT